MTDEIVNKHYADNHPLGLQPANTQLSFTDH